MKAILIGMALVGASTVGLAVTDTWADAKVTVTREESKPKTVELKAGEEVRFINSAGGNAHVMFGDNGVMFYVGKGPSRVKFDKAGTYEYTVHVSGTKVHSHTGTVIVK